jgi:hypothetical protein
MATYFGTKYPCPFQNISFFIPKGRLYVFSQYHIKQESTIMHSMTPGTQQPRHQMPLCCKLRIKETFIYLKYFYP